MSASSNASGPTWAELLHVLDEMEELHTQKVLALARRLKPGLTLDDVKNPHDFPELDDKDWHYEDGILTGVQAVKSAFLRLQRDHGDAS